MRTEILMIFTILGYREKAVRGRSSPPILAFLYIHSYVFVTHIQHSNNLVCINNIITAIISKHFGIEKDFYHIQVNNSDNNALKPIFHLFVNKNEIIRLFETI